MRMDTEERQSGALGLRWAQGFYYWRTETRSSRATSSTSTSTLQWSLFVLQWLARKKVVSGEGGSKVGFEERQLSRTGWPLVLSSDKGKWRKF
ncbi:uncharacterized protein [Lolium perenne]|uniref:uncharacterized protein n=1 Tax=Lolium perenne TaxID=4522 RepID=UPI003A997BB2